ncbi:tetratricopeptide repeat protein [Marinibaculum pumilum]|uniref:Tetratricopeptide repeat protein n=1 Tax=Marinibaculum pumilum TaxID=1766165 RepID=A0ABV7KWY5_9PROT
MPIVNFAVAVEKGKAHLDAGRPDLAAFLFGQVLEAHPTHPDAVNGMVSVLMQMGRADEAMALLRRGLEANPNHPDMRVNRGALYLMTNDYESAIRTYEGLLAEEPDDPVQLVNLGGAYMGIGRIEDALDCFRRATEVAPDYGGGHLNLGMLRMVLDTEGSAAAAEADFRRALDCDPNLHGAWLNICTLRRRAGDPEGARDAAEMALILAPHLLDYHQNFAECLLALGRRGDARKVLESLLQVNASFLPAELALAQIAVDEDRPAAAIAHLHRGTELRPQDPLIWANLAALLHRQGRIEQADTALDRALTLDPGNAAARMHKGRIQLAGGRLADGLANLAAMYDLPEVAAQSPFGRLEGAEPAWDGGPLAADLPQGGHLVLAPEPDESLTFLMFRFVAAAREKVARITFLDFRGLGPLAGQVPGIDAVAAVGDGADIPCDAIQRLGALPGLLPGALADPGATVPYLTPPPAAAKAWKDRLSALAGIANLPTIGLLWCPEGRRDPGDERALPLQQAERLLQVPNVRFVSLQFGPAQNELDELAQGGLVTRLGQHVDSPSALAGALAAVDLVIAVDGPAADLAGAMGLRAWVLLPHMPEWRWAQKDGAPIWYPTVTAFRQARAGDWESAVAAAARSLERMLGD